MDNDLPFLRIPQKIEYKPLDLSWKRKITSEEAVEIANEYWNYVDGNRDAAAGTSFVAEVVLRTDPYDDLECDHVILQWVAISRGGDGTVTPPIPCGFRFQGMCT